MPVKVLVVGGGGREHAIVNALARSEREPEILCGPGNAGIAEAARCLGVDAKDVDGLVGAACSEGAELVVVGPEAPLVAGLVDRLAEVGISAFGPLAAAARIEGSKAFAKDLMAAAGIPTARHTVLKDAGAAGEQAADADYPLVLKADGLAAGKGVIICKNEEEARAAIEVFFSERRFGETEVLCEEYLEGPELSLLALCDGENVVPLAPAQDYKRIFDADEGPNTGGMGSYSPVPGFDPERAEELADQIHRPLVRLMAERGTPFAGVLYAGIMLTDSGPKVLEFNARFGDPETQAVLPRLDTDLLELCLASAEPGGLAGSRADFSGDWAVTVVLAAAGYPESPSKGAVITGIDEAASVPGVEITHAGTALDSAGRVVTAGGRVLNVTALGSDVAEARRRAYDAAAMIRFEGAQKRTDIALRATEPVAR